jgi:hypothetical protein
MDRPTISLDELSYRPAGKTYTLREAQTIRELDAVHRITHDSIVEAGYMPPQCGGRIISYPELDPSPLTTILVAVEEGRVIGTNSITGDGPFGLHTDRHFKAETDAIRAEGRKLVSSFRIATDPRGSARRSLALVMDMVRWSYFVAWKKYDFETMLCTFNPKHEGVYARLLAARTVKLLDVMEGDHIAAGAVMMRIDRERTPAEFLAELEQIEARLATRAASTRYEETIGQLRA